MYIFNIFFKAIQPIVGKIDELKIIETCSKHYCYIPIPNIEPLEVDVKLQAPTIWLQPWSS